jgi:membrane peptidoglycan carboxypeptidase
VPAIKAGFINGLEHQFERTQEMGIRYAAGTSPVISESIGTLETHPIDMISAYGAIANGGVLMPRHMIKEIRDRDGKVVWPAADAKAVKGKRIASAQASYIMTDILAGNTQTSVNPYWGEWAIHDGIGGRYRPAAYKTGTTSDNIDVHAYGYLAPPKDKKAPALVAGVWMGNSNNDPNRGSLSLDSSAPLWSAILSEASKGMPIAQFKDSKPSGLVSANVDAYTGFKPGGATTKTVSELFIKGTAPTKSDNLHVVVDVDAASGLRWQDGCAGPKEARSFLDLRKAEPDFPQWRSATQSWQSRARGGPGRGTTYFYIGGFRPFGSSWGGRFVPGALCPIAPVGPPPCVSTDPLSPCPSAPPEGSGAPSPSPQPTKTKKP